MNDYWSDNEINACICGFYKFINLIIDGENNNKLTVKNSIDNTINYLNIENDFFYDYESIDRLILINVSELCKSILATYFDKVFLDDSDYNNDFIDNIFKDTSLTSDLKVKALRNCFMHKDFNIKKDMNIIIKSSFKGETLVGEFSILKFYEYTRNLCGEIAHKWECNFNIDELESTMLINSIEDAKDYLVYCTNNSKILIKKYVVYKITNDKEFNNELAYNYKIVSDYSNVKNQLVEFLNEYICVKKKYITQCIDTFFTLLDFCDTIRFFLNYDRQSCLDYDYAVLVDNYYNFYMNYGKGTMYMPNYKEEWDNLNVQYTFNLNLDVKRNMIERLKEAYINFSVFTFCPILDEKNYFPYNEIIVEYQPSFLNEDIRRHLRNSVIHRNYRIENDNILFEDFNNLTHKKTFEGSIKYYFIKDAILSSFNYIPYHSAFY